MFNEIPSQQNNFSVTLLFFFFFTEVGKSVFFFFSSEHRIKSKIQQNYTKISRVFLIILKSKVNLAQAPFLMFFHDVQNRWYERYVQRYDFGTKVQNREVQMVALTGMLKDKPSFKGIKCQICNLQHQLSAIDNWQRTKYSVEQICLQRKHNLNLLNNS